MSMLSDRIIRFYQSLSLNVRLPKGVNVMNPYQDDATMRVCKLFYKKFYNDDEPRTVMLGINPGRFGSGTTGISFTDPMRLERDCGIVNTMPKKPELSSDFIYRMIGAFGGPAVFYKQYFISAVSPLGFTLAGKNINYYDDRKLMNSVRPFAVDSINKVVNLGMSKEKCYCIGEGKNFNFLTELNQEYAWFKEVIPLPHPRFIMQYRRKQLDAHIRQYIELLR